MRHLIPTGLAGAFALIALGSPAEALPPLAPYEPQSLLIHVEDMETEAVEEDLVTDEFPPGAKEGGPAEDWMMPPEEGDESGDIEDEMIDKIGPGAE